jgi:hypothetical protein
VGWIALQRVPIRPLTPIERIDDDIRMTNPVENAPGESSLDAAGCARLPSRARARSSISGRQPGDQRFVSSGTRWGNGPGWGGAASGMPATGPGWGPPNGKGSAKPRADASALTPGCSAAKREMAAAVLLLRHERNQPMLDALISLLNNSESKMVQLWAADRVLTLVEGPARKRESRVF